jgi:hypothetical protein
MNIADEIKLEIGRMLREGLSEAGIKCVVDAWDHATDTLRYATFVEYGTHPESNVVEGSVVYPVTDETRLLPGGER